MREFLARCSPDKLAGLALVVALHGALFYGLSSYRAVPAPSDTAALFVSLINPPAPAEKASPPEPPRPVKLDQPRPVEPAPPQQLVAAAPVVAPTEPVAPPPVEAPASVVAAPVEVARPLAAVAPAAPAPAATPAGPVSLTEELSLSCPDRSPPTYPSAAKRRGETGQVVLRVELDESGNVARTQIASSSGSNQLDEAAQAAVRRWHCEPARRGGQAVRAVALQPFNFTLEGR